MSDTPDPPSRHGQVDGSEDSDIIDVQYAGDPEGDIVDGGAQGPSDTISAGGGEDTIFASAGADTIDGGADRDTYIVGPLLLADPVVTTAEFTTTDLSGTGYPFGAPEDPIAIRRFTLEEGAGVVGDDDATAPSLGGETFFDTDAPVTLRITSLPTIDDTQVGTLYVDRFPAGTTDSWSPVAAGDVIDLDDELVWVLSDAEAALLSATNRDVTFGYQAETVYEGVTRTAAGQVSLTIPDTAPEVDPVLAVAEDSPPFLGGFPGSDPAYDVNFDVVFGAGALDGDEVAGGSPAENAGGGTADLGITDQAGSLATPSFEILSLPEFGVLYADADPSTTTDPWTPATTGTRFSDASNLRWVIETPGPTGVAAVLQAGATQTSFTYRATLTGIDSAPATVTIDLTGLALPDGSLADDVLTNAVVVDPEASDSPLPVGFPVGSADDPVIQFRSFDMNGALDGGLDEAGREATPTLGGVSANAVPLESLTFRITALPEAGSLVVERDVDGSTQFLNVAQPGFEVRPTDRLHWAATESEATQLPADGQVVFNYVVIDDVGPASAPAVVRIDVLEADPVLTFVDDVPGFDATFQQEELDGQAPVFFKAIDVGAQGDGTALDGDLAVLEPLTGDPADLAAVSGEHGGDALIYRVTALPDVGSLWFDAGADGLSRDGSLGQDWTRIDENNLATVTLSAGDRLYWLADYDDFARQGQTTVIGNPLDGSGVPQIDNIAISDWEAPEFADGSGSPLTVRFSGRDFDGTPAEVVTLPVDAEGNVLDPTSPAYQDLLDSPAVEGLGTPIVKAGMGLAGRSPGAPEEFNDGPVRDNAFYNQVAEINAGFGAFAQASQTLVATLSTPAAGDTLHVSNLYEYEGEYGFAEAFLRGESVARIYFGYRNPFDNSLPPGIQAEINAGTAYFRELTPQSRNGDVLRDDNGDPITFPDDPGGGTRPDEGNGLGRFELTDADGGSLYFDQLELKSLNSGLLFSDPQLSTDTSDFYLHALEVTELVSPSRTSFQYEAQDPDGVTTNPTDILIDTNPPIADAVLTNWEASYFNYSADDPTIRQSGDTRSGSRSLAYEKIFTVNDLLDGDALEPNPTVERVTQGYPTAQGGDRTVWVLNPTGSSSASLGGTIPTDGPRFYTIETLPDFGALQIGSDTDGDGIIQTDEYVFAVEGATFTSDSQLRHVVSIADLADEYRTVDEGGTSLRRGGYADYFSPSVANRDLLTLAAFRSDQTVEDAYEGGIIGGEFTQLAQDYVQVLGGNGAIRVLAGSPNSDRDPTDGVLEYFDQGFTRGFRQVQKLSYFEDEDSSEGLIYDFETPVTHARFRTGGDPRDFFSGDNPAYAKVRLYLEGEEVGSFFVGALLADEQLKAQYEAERQAAEDSGTPFEPTVPNGIDVFVFTEDLEPSFQSSTVFQFSNEMVLEDGSRLGAFDTAVITNEGRTQDNSSELSGLQIVGVTFMRGQTSFGYSVTDETTGVTSATQLVTIGTDAGDALITDPVATRFAVDPEVPAPGPVTAVHSIALSVGGGLDGGLGVPELPNDADLGALSTNTAESALSFYIKTLPNLGRLYLDVGGDNPDDPNQWTEITTGRLFGGAEQLAFGTTDKIHVVLDSGTQFVTDQDISDGVSVSISDTVSSDGDNDASGVTAYVLSARQVDPRPDGEGFSENLGYANIRSPDGDASGQLLSGADGRANGGPTSGSGVARDDILQNYGASDRAVIEFDEVAARATLFLTGFGDDTRVQTSFSNGTPTNVTEGDELGFLTAFRAGQVVGQYYFGLKDPEGEGGPTDLPFLQAVRTTESNRGADLTLSEPGLSFDRLEVSVWGFANGARTQVIENGQGSPTTWNAGFQIASVEYHKLPTVDFDYTVETPDGQTADAAISIDPPVGVEPDPVRLAVNNAPDTIEGDRAIFSVEVLNGAADTDTLITLDIIDQLPYSGAYQDNRANVDDWADDLAQNGDEAGNGQITVLIRAGESRGEASILINAEGDANVEADEFLTATVSNVEKASGRQVLVHDDSGNVRIIEASNAVAVSDLSLNVDAPPDPDFLTDSELGDILFWRRIQIDTDADVFSNTDIDAIVSDRIATDTPFDANDVFYSFETEPVWGGIFRNSASFGDDQTGRIFDVLTPQSFSNSEQFYWVVSRDDALPTEFSENPSLYQEAGGSDPAFDRPSAWSSNAGLSFSALDDAGNAASVSFEFTPDVDDTVGGTRIGVDSGTDDPNPALISTGETHGTSEELRISYDGPADLIWAEIDLDDFATQTSLESGLYEIAEVTVVHDGQVIATYLVGDGAANGRPAFSVDTNGSTTTGDDRFDPRWIEADADGRFTIGGFDFDEIRLSAFGFADGDPFDTTLNPVEAGGVRASFALNSVSFLRSEDLATGTAPRVSMTYTGRLLSIDGSESPAGTIEIALSDDNVENSAVQTPSEPNPSMPNPVDGMDPVGPTPDPNQTPAPNNPITPSAADPLVIFETVRVRVDDTGDGTVEKQNEGATDNVTSVENFVAAEVDDQRDSITLTTAVDLADTDAISGLSDDAVGTFIADDDPTPITFGPSEPTQLSDLLAQNRPGTYQIVDGDESGQVGNISFSNFEEINFDVLCFAKGMRISTKRGEKCVEDLKPGDDVWTLDHGFQPIRWHGVTRLPALGAAAPIVFEPGTLGNTRPLIVSRQHRILFAGQYAELLFGVPEVFIAAHMLEDGHGVHKICGGTAEYHHILLERHSILRAEGVLTESYFPGKTSWKVLTADDKKDIATVFPRIARDGPAAYGDLCRMALKEREARVLRDSLPFWPTYPDETNFAGALSAAN